MSALSSEDASITGNLFLEEPASLPELDGWIERHNKSQNRFTFSEEEVLQSLWDEGEEIRLREDHRFRRVSLPQQQGIPQWRLAHHTVANQSLYEAILDEHWDGHDLAVFLAHLDRQGTDRTFHIFAQGDERFLLTQDELGVYHLALRAAAEVEQLSLEAKCILDEIASRLPERLSSESGTLWTTTQLLELLKILADSSASLESITPASLTEWLIQQDEWARVGLEHWILKAHLPSLSARRHYAVWPIFSSAKDARSLVPQLVNEHTPAFDAVEPLAPPEEISRASSPRDHITWRVVLRTVHLNEGRIPVPNQARPFYPHARKLAECIALPGLWMANGDQIITWLDRSRHELFGPDLQDQFTFLEAGAILVVAWRAAGFTFQVMGIDLQVTEEESRLVDLTTLTHLRATLLESYRGSLRAILAGQDQFLSFQELYQALCQRQQHIPNRATIRTLLSSLPEFVFTKATGKWCLNPEITPEVGARALRRSLMVGNEVRDDSTTTHQDPGLPSLSQMIAKQREYLKSLRSKYLSSKEEQDPDIHPSHG